MTLQHTETSPALTLQEQLHHEERVCPECRFVVANPFTARCPRCLTVLPTLELSCTSCIHRQSCPVIPASTKKDI